MNVLWDSSVYKVRDHHAYLSSVVDPDSALGVAHSHILPPWRPADPIQGRRSLDGDAGSWYLVERENERKKKYLNENATGV